MSDDILEGHEVTKSIGGYGTYTGVTHWIAVRFMTEFGCPIPYRLREHTSALGLPQALQRRHTIGSHATRPELEGSLRRDSFYTTTETHGANERHPMR